MQSREFAFALILLAPFAVGYLLPRVSAYFLGPALLGAPAIAFVCLHRLFFPFQSDGSPAGLLVPAIMWAGSIVACIGGIVLIATGLMRIRSKHGPAQPPPTADQALSSSAHGSWRLFTAALGIATVIAPFLPLYRMVAHLDVAIMRSIGLLGWQVLLLLCTYVLPTFVLFCGLRLSGLHRQFASSNRGSLPILFGTAVILFFDLASIATLISTGAVRLVYIVIGPFHDLVWVARAAVLIGLFLRWQAQRFSRVYEPLEILPRRQ